MLTWLHKSAIKRKITDVTGSGEGKPLEATESGFDIRSEPLWRYIPQKIGEIHRRQFSIVFRLEHTKVPLSRIIPGGDFRAFDQQNVWILRQAYHDQDCH